MTDALAGKPAQPVEVLDRKGRPVNLERAVVKIFTGIAFIVVACALGFSATGRGWWFWMLIPGFTSLGAGVAQYLQLRSAAAAPVRFAAPNQRAVGAAPQENALPPTQTEYVSPAESRYKTGELVPPSVTEGTTRHLEMDNESETMTLPKI